MANEWIREALQRPSLWAALRSNKNPEVTVEDSDVDGISFPRVRIAIWELLDTILGRRSGQLSLVLWPSLILSIVFTSFDRRELRTDSLRCFTECMDLLQHFPRSLCLDQPGSRSLQAIALFEPWGLTLFPNGSVDLPVQKQRAMKTKRRSLLASRYNEHLEGISTEC